VADLVAEGFDAALEALRFLDARVRLLEDERERTREPVFGTASLAPEIDVTPWLGAVDAWIEAHPPSGQLLVGECGEGSLALALAGRIADVVGLEPRAERAWQAASRGLEVRVADVPAHLAAHDGAPLGGLVLVGIVDRLGIADTLVLIDDVARALRSGAPLVVIGTSAAGAMQWPPHARDLLAGRPFDPSTWELLLGRSGFTALEPLEPEGSSGASFGLAGIRS
jgi:hypothetical protein